ASRIHITPLHFVEHLKFHNTLVDALFHFGSETPGRIAGPLTNTSAPARPKAGRLPRLPAGTRQKGLPGHFHRNVVGCRQYFGICG
ncbi:MAG TPA: hypothetical protein VHS80_14700, partial [Chthoniobacterales bacterium]|nr:hypothetical protein [Chthoniobacterales bacterium]